MLIEVQLIKILAGNISISLSLTYHYSAACSVCSASAAGGSAAGAGSVRNRGQQMYILFQKSIKLHAHQESTCMNILNYF